MDITQWVQRCYEAETAAGWNHDAKTGKPIRHNIPERLMLIVSEIAEAMEGDRKNLMDDHLTHRRMIEVELADAVIRIFNLAGYLGLDLQGAMEEKLVYNASRSDHKKEQRDKAHGKRY